MSAGTSSRSPLRRHAPHSINAPVTPKNAVKSARTVDSAAALSTVRADFTAFFGVTGALMLWGAWRRNGDLLLVPALIYGTAFTCRAINLAVHGPYPLFFQPMAVEAFWTVLLFTAWRVLPHHKIAEIAG